MTLEETNMRALTGLRFLAATLVFFHHTQWRNQVDLFAYGWVGVPVFFMLSGFLFTALYGHSFRRLDRTIPAFYWKRLTRLYPAYLLALILAVIYRGGMDLKPLLFNLALAQQVDVAYRFAIIPVFWTISIEASFYLIFPFLTHFAHRVGPAGVAVAPAAAVLFFALGLIFLQGSAAVGDWSYMTIFGQMPTFALGMFVGRLFVEGRLRAFNRLGAANALGFVAVALFALGFFYWIPFVRGLNLHLYGVSEEFLICLPFSLGTVPLLGSLLGPSVFRAVLGLPLVVALGHASYMLYLFHDIGQILYTLSPMEAVVAFVLLNVVAWTLWRWFELPVQKYLRR